MISRERNKVSAKLVFPPPVVEVLIGYATIPVKLDITEAKDLHVQLAKVMDELRNKQIEK